MAHGGGFSVDGVHPTNGVQPVIVLFYSACFKLAGDDRWLGVRLTFGLVALFEALCVIVIYRLVEKMKRPGVQYAVDPALTAAFVWATLLSNLIHNAIGLETGLYALMILLSALVYQSILSRDRSAGSGWGSLMLFGIVLGLTVLARIDAVFLVASLLLVHLAVRRGDLLRSRTVQASVIGAVAVLVSSPWWIYNYTTFGSLMPISGQSESIGTFIGLNLTTSATVLADICFVLFYLPNGFPPSMLATVVAVVVLLVVALVKYRTKLLARLSERYDTRVISALALFSLCIFLYYTFVFSAPHFIGRYFHPIRVLALLVGVLLVPIVAEQIRAKQIAAWKRYAIYAYLLAGVAFNLTHYVYNFTVRETNPLYWAGVWSKQHPQYVLGMTSSGTANFVSGRVINLDGKVNVDALHARRADTMGRYIAHAGINVILDMDQPSIEDARKAGAVFIPIDTFKGSVYFLRK